MHEGNINPHRLQRYTFCTYYIHISYIFYAFLTHLYRIVAQGSTPSRALVLDSSLAARWQLAQRATSEERARKKRGTSAPVRQPSAVALSRCRQPLPFRKLGGGRWQAVAAGGGSFAAGRQGAGGGGWSATAAAAWGSFRLKPKRRHGGGGGGGCPHSEGRKRAPKRRGRRRRRRRRAAA